MSRVRRWAGPAALVVVFLWAWFDLDLETGRLWAAWNAIVTITAEAWPPDFSQAALIAGALVETVQIAVLATVFGTLVSVPMGLLAARNLFPPALATPVRWLAAAVRVLPSILWAFIAVLVIGPGPLAGVVAMTLYTVGYLAKLQSEAFEGIPRDALDAVRAMGLGRGTVAWHVALPEAANALRSQILFMFEYNVRSSSVIGFVGAGGIGQLLLIYLDFRFYDQMNAVLLALFATVVVIDGMSYLIRRRYVELEEAPRARWKDILWPPRGPIE